jgi:predicted HTH domain antitoxin
MPLTISDERLQEAGLNEQEARLEIACRMYECRRLSLPAASRWAGVTRTELESALMDRNIPLVRIDVNDLQQDLRTLAKFEAGR